MTLPVVLPTKLIERAARKGLWPTAMECRREGDQLVGVVLAWGPKHAKIEPDAGPKSRRGVVASTAAKQGALDL